MSMFYELMMRKKTGIMYATIKGSLTENDGVFSGFISQTNYLQLPSLTVEQIGTDSTFVARFKKTSGNYRPIYNSGGNSVLWININSSDKVVVKIGNITQFTTSSALDIDWTQYHTIKVVFKNYKVSIFIDNILFEEHQFATPTNLTVERPIYIGNETWNTSSGTSYTDYYIDLPKCYIKLGSTKYNIVASEE